MYQKTQIIGYVGVDPQLAYTNNGTAYTSFSVATHSKRKDNNGAIVETVMWMQVYCYGAKAENAAKYVKKGSLVFVEGFLRCDDTGGPVVFERKNGSKMAKFELVANVITYLARSNESDSSGTQADVEDQYPF